MFFLFKTRNCGSEQRRACCAGIERSFTSAGMPPSLLDPDILSLLRDRDSNIWVGTSRGLFRYNAHGVSLSSLEWASTAVFEDREGNIWIGNTRGMDDCETAPS